MPPSSSARLFAWICALTLLSGCGGSGEDAQTGDDAAQTDAHDHDASANEDASVDDDAARPGPEACGVRPTPLRRLSHFEYANTMRDLFPGAALPDLSLPADNRPHEFDNDAEGTVPTPSLVERYVDLGRQVAEALGPALPGLVDCAPADQGAAEVARCGERFVREVGARVFRRPLTEDEVTTYSAFLSADLAGAAYQDRLTLTLQLLLAAPEFLYRFEAPTRALAPGEASAPLEAYALASRLSYFLWATMPDEALLAAAADGSLLEPAVLRAQAERMLEDERARATFNRFHTQWLDVERIDHVTKAAEDGLTDALRASIKAQVEVFVDRVLFDARGTLGDLLASERVFIDPLLADLYGVEAPAEGWVETTVEHRAGVLTQPAFLASHGHPDKPSPVLRGVFVLDRILCVSLGSPPANAEAQASAVADTIEGPLTNRAFYDLITAEAPCSSCHQTINPIGAAFERFDTMGRHQTHDPNGLEIDASASVEGFSFTDARDLALQLAQDEAVETCAVRKWVRYAYAGGPLERSACFIDALRDHYKNEGGSVRDLQLAIITHPSFATFVTPEHDDATPDP